MYIDYTFIFKSMRLKCVCVKLTFEEKDLKRECAIKLIPFDSSDLIDCK